MAENNYFSRIFGRFKRIVHESYRWLRSYFPKPTTIKEATNDFVFRNSINNVVFENDELESANRSLRSMVELIWENRFTLSYLTRIKNLSKYSQEIDSYHKNRLKRKTGDIKVAVYTAITANYDSIKLPEKLDERVDYVLFTDNINEQDSVYSTELITYFNEDPTRTSRYIKMHPHHLLNEYDIVVWLDSSITIVDDFWNDIKEFVRSNKPVAAVPHPDRKNIKEELQICIDRNKDSEKTMTEQVKKYLTDSKFNDTELIESGYMMFNLNHQDTSNFLKKWWAEIERYSKRDQLSFSYSIQATNTQWHPLTMKPNSIRNHPSFILSTHNSPLSQTLPKILKQDLDRLRIDKQHTNMKIKTTKASHRKIIESVDVVVCVHNAYKEVKRCIDSILKNMPKKSTLKVNVILVDDGSSNKTKKLLENTAVNNSFVDLIRNEEAGGYTRAANQGMSASNSDSVFLLNSDTVVTKRWLEKLISALEANEGAGIVGPLSNAASLQSLPNISSTKSQTAINLLPKSISMDMMNNFCEKYSLGIFPKVQLVHGFCMGIRKEVIQEIGKFDEKSFPRGYGEENDFCFRATDAGFNLVIATNTYIYHEKSKSFNESERIELMKQGSKQLSKLHSRRRITNAIKSMQDNPLLIRMRVGAKKFYKNKNIHSIENVSGKQK